MSKLAARFNQENGQILVIGALLATALLGLVGLIVDGGLLYAERRQAQNGADEAALAAAFELWYGGSDEDAIVASFENAAANGFDNASGNTVTVNIPPTAGEHAGDPDFVEVVVSAEPTTFFIHALTPGGLVQGRGVAGIVPVPHPYALIILDEHACEAYLQSGAASLTIAGGDLMVNSDCQSDALKVSASGDLTVDGTIEVHGGYEIGGSGTVSPDPTTVGWTVPDPLADVPPPPLGAPAPGSTGTAASPETWSHGSGGDLTLQPGTFYGGFSANCSCTVTMEAGIYVMAGGGFTKTGSTRFVGDGVMIYVTDNPTNPTGDGEPLPFTLGGSGGLALSPPTSGLYQGISLWQGAAIDDRFKIRGSVDLLSGVIYAPTAELDISGSGSTGSVQIIVSKFYIHGGQPLDITFGEFVETDGPGVALVE